MGQFSWLTQDTRKSISSLKPFEVTMTDNKGNKWTEKNYEGYGDFDGKDFYSLLSEMNGGNGDRDHGIKLYFGDEPFISPNLTENKDHKWVNRCPEDCPRQGWVVYNKFGEDITDWEEDDEEDEDDE
jgi:hypothetical protein